MQLENSSYIFWNQPGPTFPESLSFPLRFEGCTDEKLIQSFLRRFPGRDAAVLPVHLSAAPYQQRVVNAQTILIDILNDFIRIYTNRCFRSPISDIATAITCQRSVRTLDSFRRRSNAGEEASYQAPTRNGTAIGQGLSMNLTKSKRDDSAEATARCQRRQENASAWKSLGEKISVSRWDHVSAVDEIRQQRDRV